MTHAYSKRATCMQAPNTPLPTLQNTGCTHAPLIGIPNVHRTTCCAVRSHRKGAAPWTAPAPAILRDTGDNRTRKPKEPRAHKTSGRRSLLVAPRENMRWKASASQATPPTHLLFLRRGGSRTVTTGTSIFSLASSLCDGCKINPAFASHRLILVRITRRARAKQVATRG